MDTLVGGKLLDTTVLIDLSRGRSAAAECVDSERLAGTTFFVSVISAMELIAGCRDKGEAAKIRKLVAEFTLLQFDNVLSNIIFVQV